MKKLMAYSLLAAGLIGLCGSGAMAQEKPLKVLILAGQSNMQGHAHVRTFDPMGLDPKTAPILKEMRNADGTPRVCEKVWISSIGCAEEEQVGKLTAGYGAKQRGPNIGPEFTFGIYMQKLLDEPILIIKTAWGGKSLNTDFRPPSAGPYEFNDAQLKGLKKQGKDIEKVKADKAKMTGHYYRLMIDHVKKVLADIRRGYPDYDPQAGYEPAGSNLPNFLRFCDYTSCHSVVIGDDAHDAYFAQGRNLYAIVWTAGGDTHGLQNSSSFSDKGITKPPYGVEGTNYVLSCTDCHETHGSPNQWLLRTTVNGVDVGEFEQGKWYNFCLACHEFTVSYTPHDYPDMMPCSTTSCHYHGRGDDNF